MEKRKHKFRAKYISQSSSSEEDQSSVHMKRSFKPPRAPSGQDQLQHDPDPLFYREVAMVDKGEFQLYLIHRCCFDLENSLRYLFKG